MPSAGLLAQDSRLYHHLPHDDPLLGDAPVFGAAPLSGDAPLSPGDILVFGDGDLVFDDVLVPHNDVSEASACLRRVAGAVSSGISRALCCWHWRRWIGYS